MKLLISLLRLKFMERSLHISFFVWPWSIHLFVVVVWFHGWLLLSCAHKRSLLLGLYTVLRAWKWIYVFCPVSMLYEMIVSYTHESYFWYSCYKANSICRPTPDNALLITKNDNLSHNRCTIFPCSITRRDLERCCFLHASSFNRASADEKFSIGYYVTRIDYLLFVNFIMLYQGFSSVW